MRRTPQEREILYTAAFNLYQMGNYQKASDLFSHLLLESPMEMRYWKGFASSKQMQKCYKEALHAWGSYSLVSGNHPDGHFHAAECYLSQGDLDEAKKALSCAKHFAGKDSRMAEKIEQLEERWPSNL